MAQTEETVISVQNTFGLEPWFMARLGLHNPGHIALFSVVAVTGLWTILGIPAAILGAIASANDLVAAAGKRKAVKPPVDLLRLKDGGWSFVSGEVRSLPSTSPKDELVDDEINDDDNAWVQAYNAIDKPVDVKSETVKDESLSDPADRTTSTIPRSAEVPLSSNPFAAMTPDEQVAVMDRQIGKGHYQPEGIAAKDKTDIEKALESEIEREVESRIGVNPAKVSNLLNTPPSVIDELFIQEDGYYRSWFTMGITGSGKGVFIAYALLMAKAHMPNVSIWAIDPKADPKEYSRWAFIPESQRYHYSALRPRFGREEQNKIKGGINRVLDGYAADQSEYKLLVIDELPAILRSQGNAARATLKYLNAIASMGRSDNRIVWIFSNAIGMQQNGVTGGDMNYYHQMYLGTSRKINPICNYDKFEGPRIASSDGVFKDTGRAAWASTTDEWQVVPTSYRDVVERLPYASAPPNFGDGDYKDAQGEVAIANLADELVDTLEERGLQKGKLIELMAGTSFADLLEKDKSTIGTIGEGLRKFPALLTVRKSRGEYSVALPKQDEQPKSDRREDNGAAFNFDFL